jgi:hypothetical protein
VSAAHRPVSTARGQDAGGRSTIFLKITMFPSDPKARAWPGIRSDVQLIRVESERLGSGVIIRPREHDPVDRAFYRYGSRTAGLQDGAGIHPGREG